MNNHTIRGIFFLLCFTLIGTESWADPMACQSRFRHVETQYRIPLGLLESIAQTESGYRVPGTKTYTPWPWTVMAEGRGRYLKTKAEAIREVKKLKAKGVRNIDVGCMQVNLKYHPKAFASLDEAFDPASNMAYAATLLRRLRESNGTWSKAVGNYHSGTPHLHTRYRNKVLKKWWKNRNKFNASSGQQYAYHTPARPSQQQMLAGRQRTSLQVKSYTRPGDGYVNVGGKYIKIIRGR